MVLLGCAGAPGSAGSRPPRKAGSSPCVEEAEERALHIGVGASWLALQRTRGLLGARRAGVSAGAGAAARTPECSPCVVLAQGWQEPFCQGSEAPPAPLILGHFAHTSALLMSWTRVPAKRVIITWTQSPVLREHSEEVVTASQVNWSDPSLGLALSTQQSKYTRVSKTELLCQQGHQTTLRSACKTAGQNQPRFLEGIRKSFLLQARGTSEGGGSALL